MDEFNNMMMTEHVRDVEELLQAVVRLEDLARRDARDAGVENGVMVVGTSPDTAAGQAYQLIQTIPYGMVPTAMMGLADLANRFKDEVLMLLDHIYAAKVSLESGSGVVALGHLECALEESSFERATEQ